MRLMDIPAHFLFLAAEHRFLCIAIAFAVWLRYSGTPRQRSVVAVAWLY